MQFRGELTANKQLGQGGECVYLWYNKPDFELAKHRKEPIWPCKIGRTTGEPTARIIASGVYTAFPSDPVLALVLKTDDSRNLESVIHGVLRFGGRDIKTSPGREWFQTNPDEIESLYRGLGRMLSDLAMEERGS